MEIDYKQEFLKAFKENIKREGADKLLEYMQSTDFFTAPASTRHHSIYEGGLVEHSYKVFKRFVRILEFEYGTNWQEKVSLESATIMALLHDICKVNFYAIDYRNVKNERGEWERKPYYTVKDSLPYGHGEKSVYIISGFMKLTREEAMAINWHMGPYDLRAQSNSYILSQVFEEYTTALLLHMADFQSTYLDESR